MAGAQMAVFYANHSGNAEPARRRRKIETPMNGFFEMGGYGAYIWPAYAISAIGLGGLVFVVIRRYARLRSSLSKRLTNAARDDRTGN